MEYEVIHNEDQSRFEAHIGEQTALVDYIKDANNCMNITHTEVPRNLEGQGIAAKLTKTILDYARSNGFKVRPICPYTKTYIAKHTEYLDIVAK